MNFIASQAIARSQQKQDEGNGDGDGTEAEEHEDAMAALERQARAPVGFVAASTGPEGGNQPKEAQQAVAANPDAIEVDDDEDDDY